MALMKMPTYAGGGGTDLTVNATSRTGDVNKAYARTYSIPSGIKKVAIAFTGHSQNSVSGRPTVTWNGASIAPDESIVYDYTGLVGVWSVSSVNKYTLDGSGGNLVVTGADANYDSCCIY